MLPRRPAPSGLQNRRGQTGTGTTSTHKHTQILSSLAPRRDGRSSTISSAFPFVRSQSGEIETISRLRRYRLPRVSVCLTALETAGPAAVIASAAKQPSSILDQALGCFVAPLLAKTNGDARDSSAVRQTLEHDVTQDPCRLFGIMLQQTAEGREKNGPFHGLGHVSIHAGREASLRVFHHGIGRQADDRRPREAGPSPHEAGSPGWR